MIERLVNTDEPSVEWLFAGQRFRFCTVAGITKFEQHIAGEWRILLPGHDLQAALVGVEKLIALTRAMHKVNLDLRVKDHGGSCRA